MEGLVRINLGSGKHYFPNATNVDLDERADIVHDVRTLPFFEDESVDEIYGIHLFEHFDRMGLGPILTEWRRVLKQGGKLILEMPCLDKIARMIVAGETDSRLTLKGIFGEVGHPNPYMKHQWCYSMKELYDIMKEAGFEPVIGEPTFHVKPRDMRVTAVK